LPSEAKSSKGFGREQNRATTNRLLAVELASGNLDGSGRPPCALKIVPSSVRQIEVKPDFNSDTSLGW